MCSYQSVRDHPRIRGEHAERHRPRGNFTGSSPHTRGARLRQTRPRRPERIIPAYAGSTRADGGLDRGALGSSPHTRGARGRGRRRPSRRRIIPAYAGSTSTGPTRERTARDHPRIRGEHAALASQAHSIAGSSPHTRGAHPSQLHHLIRSGIIPAYAGSTRTRGVVVAAVEDHPRIRGEHVGELRVAHTDVGSSPHTRGARARPP